MKSFLEFQRIDELSKETLKSYVEKGLSKGVKDTFAGKGDISVKREKGLIKAMKKVYKEDLDESHLIHVSDGSKYNDKPNKKDVSHVMSGVKTHGGVYDNSTDKGAIFKFKSHSDADNFKRHVDKCPGRTCYADHMDEEVEENLDEADRIPFVNGRTHAQAGKMHPRMSKHMTVGQEHDYYHPKSGNKISGVVKHKSDTEVHMQANKGDRVGGGDTHKFTISEEIPPWKTDSDSKKKKSTSFKKLNNPTRTGNDAARALALRGLSAARKKVEEAVSITPNAVQKLKAALDRHTDRAISANKTGDHDAVKVHQTNANKIKTKLGNFAKNPSQYNENEESELDEGQLDELSHDKLTSYIRRAKHDETKNRSTGVVLAQKKKWGGLVSGTTAAKVPATNEEDKLIGKQKVLDKNRNGKLDAHDFKLLRKEETEINELTQDVGHSEWSDNVKQAHPGVQLIKNLNQHGHHTSTYAVLNSEKVGQYTMHSGIGKFKTPKKQGAAKNQKLTYKEMVEGTFTYKDGVTMHRGDYGTSYYKDVAKDDKDDDLNFKTKKTKTIANKPIARKSGRPVGSKSGARDRLKSDTPSYGGIAFHGYNGPTKI